MSDCRRTEERLTPYTDDALPSAERAVVERHLEKCPPCRTAAEHEQGGRTLLRERAAQLKAEAAPPAFRTRCAALAREHCGKRSMVWWRGGVVGGLVTAAVMIVAGLALFSFATRQFDTVLAAQLTLDHVKCFRAFAPSHLEQVNATQIEDQLEADYGWDVHIPPSSPENGVELIGARRCLYADGAVPHVMYRVGGQDVSLYMLEGVQRRPAELLTWGHNARVWSRGATTYVLVSSPGSQDLTRAVRYVMQEAH
jgi:anti-sigma factor RsiW